MRLLICSPVMLWHPPEAIREWIAELAAMRERYAGDDEALGCITSAQEDAQRTLTLALSLPAISPPKP